VEVLGTLVDSRLATKADSDVVQVIAEHVALGEDAEGDHEGLEGGGDQLSGI
jgi:hypothetical protein